MKIDLEGLAWMDDATRTKAEDKLAKIVNKIGYPSKWRSYDGLAVDRESFLANAERASAFEVKRELAKVGKPVDKEEWEMTPPTVNAYYEPTMNEMVFPAGILQEPFYGKGQTPALNFGAIGMVVGHELTHGFDDEGRQFDAEGNLRDWWSPAVGAEFDKRAACVEHQFDEYVPIDDMHIKGKLTLGENIADLGGLKLSFAALQRAALAGAGAATVEPTRRPRPARRCRASAASRPRSSSSSASRRRGAPTIAPRRCGSWSRPTRTRRPSTASSGRSRTCPSSRPPSSARRAARWCRLPRSVARSGEAEPGRPEGAVCREASRDG